MPVLEKGTGNPLPCLDVPHIQDLTSAGWYAVKAGRGDSGEEGRQARERGDKAVKAPREGGVRAPW